MTRHKMALVIVALLIAAAPAAAADDWKFYAGSEYQYTSVDFDTFGAPLINGGQIHFGAKYGRYYAAEIGFGTSYASGAMTRKGEYFGDGTISQYGGMIDLYGYLPLGKSRFSTFFTVGAGYMSGKVKSKLTTKSTTTSNYTFWMGLEDDDNPYVDTNDAGEVVGVTLADTSDVSFRVGGGLEYRINDALSVRATGRYQSGGFGAITSNYQIVGSIGINYTF